MLFKRKQTSLTVKEKKTHNEKELMLYFCCFHHTCKELKLKRRDLYNINKTSSRIDVNRTQIVITIKLHKRLLLIDANNRDYITSIKCISADTDKYALLAFLIVCNIFER